MTLRWLHRLIGPILALTLSPALPAASGAEVITGLKPAEPAPAAAQLTPGLAVVYAYAIVNHLSEFGGKKFDPGPPLPHLDYKVGSGTVLTSKSDNGVLAIITGFIQLDKPGVWGFDVTSNDGVRLEIGGKQLYEDPTVHSDDTSDRIDVKIDQPGWYPIRVHYFEKRYTSTLILRWAAPGEKKLVPVPGKAFAHLKK
jgi:hypothetical protein